MYTTWYSSPTGSTLGAELCTKLSCPAEHNALTRSLQLGAAGALADLLCAMGAGRKTSTYDVDTRAGEVRSFEDLQRKLTEELGGCIFGASPRLAASVCAANSQCCSHPAWRATGLCIREAPARPFACRVGALSVSLVKEARSMPCGIANLNCAAQAALTTHMRSA